MRAVRWHGRGDVRLDHLPQPQPGPDEVLVRVELCGICGTDVEEYRNGPIAINAAAPHPLTGTRAPVTLGHEAVGVVAGHGASVDPATLPLGTRIVPDVVIGCGRCWWCRRHQETVCERQAVRGLNLDGGLATFMVAEAATVVVVPASLPPETAVLAEPTAVAVRAVRKVADLAGTTVLVQGAGTIGLLVTQVAQAAGARVVAVDVAPPRLRLAEDAGAEAATPERVADTLAQLTQGRGADVVFECTGLPGQLPVAVGHCRRGGAVVLVGFSDVQAPLPLLNVVLQEKRLIGTAAHLWDEDVTSAVRLLAAGLVDPRRLPMAVADLAEVPALLAKPDPEVVKVAVRP